MTDWDKTPRYWALALLAVSGLVLAGSLLASVWASLGGTSIGTDSPPHPFGDESVYLTPESPGDTSCVIDRPDGRAESASLHKEPSSTLFAHGTEIADAPGTSAIRCGGPVRITSGWILDLYPLSEANGWLAIPCAVAAATGWTYRKR